MDIVHAVTLGVGSSVQGLTLFLTGALAFRLGREVWAPLAWLAASTVLYLPVSRLVVPAAPPLVGPAITFVVYWGAIIVTVPPLRRAVSPVLSRLSRRGP